VPTELLVPSEPLIKFCTMCGGGYLKSDVAMCSSLVRNAAELISIRQHFSLEFYQQRLRRYE
jgi:hypothetical protein